MCSLSVQGWGASLTSVRCLRGRNGGPSAMTEAQCIFLSADTTATASAMVSASAPSVYSVQALSLLAEVSAHLTCPPSVV